MIAVPPRPLFAERPRARLAAALLSLHLCACGAPRPEPSLPLPIAAPEPPARTGAPSPARSDGSSEARPAQVAIDDPGAAPSLEGATPLHLARPPFGAALVRRAPGGSSPPPRLVKISEQKNGITDEEAWFARNGISLPQLRVPNETGREAGDLPPFIPARYRVSRLVRGIDDGDHTILLYGSNFADGRYLAILDREHKALSFFDFEAFLTPPELAPAEARFVQGEVVWAAVRDGVLYVSTGHRTYAASSKGKNAFLSAIDARSGELLWQSAPLVCNARNFVVHGDHLLCGYGFTAEPDFLYVVERATGRTTAKIPVKSGPDFLIERDGKLFVRTYDTDYVFEIR